MARQKKARSHVDIHDRDQILGIGVRDQAIVDGYVDQFFARALATEPGIGILGGHPGHRRKERARLTQVLVEGKPQMSPACHIEDRKGHIGPKNFVGDFRGVKGVVEGDAAFLCRCMAPRHRVSALPDTLASRETLRARNQGKIALSLLNPESRVSQHLLRRGSAHPGEISAAFSQAKPLSQTARCIVVSPADVEDHADIVDRIDDAMAPAIPCGGLRHLRP